MLKLTIHRGTEQIGGSAVEINDGKTRVLFDFGIPLESMDREEFTLEEYNLPIKGLCKKEKPQFAGIFLTHAHADHFGLLELVHPEIPIYVTETTFDILTKITPLTSKFDTSKLNLAVIKEPVIAGDFEICAHEVTHSIAGACAYEIKSNGKTIVYTGDIRFHGRCEYKNKRFVSLAKNPDYLIMEGTTLGRSKQDIVSEEDLELKLKEEFLKDKLPLVLFSPQNLDRLVTVYKACVNTGKELVLDPYSCYMLELYGKLGKSIPQHYWNNIRVQFYKNDITEWLLETNKAWKYKDKKVGIKEIQENPEKFVVKGGFPITGMVLKSFEKEKLNVIFSMWEGYLDKPNRLLDPYKDIIQVIHTSGHAYIKDLQEFVETLAPKNIIPIHTECKADYKKYFKENIILLNDGEVLDVD